MDSRIISIKTIAFEAGRLINHLGHPPLQTEPFEVNPYAEDRYFLSDPLNNLGVLVEWSYNSVNDYMLLCIIVRPVSGGQWGVDAILSSQDRVSLSADELSKRYIVPACEAICSRLAYESSKSLLMV